MRGSNPTAPDTLFLGRRTVLGHIGILGLEAVRFGAPHQRKEGAGHWGLSPPAETHPCVVGTNIAVHPPELCWFSEKPSPTCTPGCKCALDMTQKAKRHSMAVD